MIKIGFELMKVCVFIVLVNEGINIAIKHFGAPKEIAKFLNKVILFFILFNGLYNVLVAFGVDGKSIQSGGILVGILVGVASKKTIENILAGVFLEVEDLIHPFDFIVINKYMGIVVEKNLFYIMLEDGDENRKKIRCKEFTSFSNASFNPSTIYIDAKVSTKVPMKEIDEIVATVFENAQQKFATFIEMPEFLGIEKFKDGKMYLRFMGRCKGKDRKKSIVSLTNAIHKAFTQKGVALLLPQMEVN